MAPASSSSSVRRSRPHSRQTTAASSSICVAVLLAGAAPPNPARGGTYLKGDRPHCPGPTSQRSSREGVQLPSPGASDLLFGLGVAQGSMLRRASPQVWHCPRLAVRGLEMSIRKLEGEKSSLAGLRAAGVENGACQRTPNLCWSSNSTSSAGSQDQSIVTSE